jgi:membrane protein involved in colicin uptake
VLAFVSTNEGPSQDAKSVAIDATLNAKKYQSAMDVQREEQMLDQRSREYERELIKERRAKAKARAEAQAEREAEAAAAAAEREAEAEAATQAATRESSGGATSQSGSSNLPELLLTIRSHESGGSYSAYNGSGCEGYGCGGAYQLHAKYASGWAASAGYSGMSSNAADWSPEVQDKVALWLFYSTNPDGAHWCNWTTYC